MMQAGNRGDGAGFRSRARVLGQARHRAVEAAPNIHEDELAVTLQRLYLVLVADEEALEKERRVRPGTIQPLDVEPGGELRGRYLFEMRPHFRPASSPLR